MASGTSPSPAETERHPAELVGRDRDLDHLRTQLQPGQTIVLWGPPGVGKTRLAQAVGFASDHGESFRFVDASDRTTLEQVLDALEVELDNQTPRDSTVGERCRRLVNAADALELDCVVVDGVDDPDLLEALLEAWAGGGRAPALLITSRVSADRDDVVAYRLEGLSPEDGAQLFVEAGRRHLRGFEPDDETRETLEELSRRLDGLPLALELAASRLSIMNPDQLLERAAERFELLDASSKAVDLEETIGWSWERLSDDERTCLVQCAAFRHSFSLSAAEYVVDGATLESSRVMNLLDDLARKSWLHIRRDAGGEVRFEWLRTLREFLTRREAFDDELEAARERHAEYCRRLARETDRRGASSGGPDVADSLRREERELRSAVDRLFDRHPTRAFEILVAFRWPTILGQMPTGEIAQLLDTALEHADDQGESRWVVRFASWATELASRRGDHERAGEYAARAQAAANEVGNPLVAAEAKHAASLALTRLDPEVAEQRLQEGLEALEGASDDGAWLWEGRIRERLGFLALKNFDLSRAAEHFERAKDLMAGRANPLLTTGIHAGLGWVQFRVGRTESAVAGLRRTVSIYDAHGTPGREAVARFNLGAALHAVGELGEAEQQWRRAEDLWESAHRVDRRVLLLARKGMVSLERGTTDDAQRRFEEAVERAYESGDDHHRAISEAYLEILSLAVENQAVDPFVFRRFSREITAPVDPDAAAAVHGFRALASAVSEEPERVRESLRDIGGVLEVLGSEDRYYRSAVIGISRAAARAAEEIVPGADFEPESFVGNDESPLVPAVAENFDAETIADAPRLGNHHLRLAVRLGRRLAFGRPLDEGGDPQPAEVVVHRYGNWFEVRGKEGVDLRNRGPLRRLLRRLVQSHVSEHEEGCSVQELVEAGWPDETLTDQSGANRVYTSVRMLRDLGLEGHLSTGDAGYYLDASEGLSVTEEAFDEFERDPAS